jgi:DNA excision repair protein ERCC-2
MRKIHIDVKHFAVPCPLVGNIEVHSGYGAPPFKGQEIHQMIQRRRIREDEDYIPEKQVNFTFIKDPFEFTIEGRSDGFKEKPAWFEEIKSTFDIDELRFKLVREPNHPYIWQLRTYGYFYFKQTGETPKLNLFLVSSRNFRSVELEIDLDVEDYERWINLRIEKLYSETLAKEKLFQKRKVMSAKMIFPFESPRHGQKELVQTVEKHFEEQNPLLIQAPTGLGKTVGVLFPALKESASRGQKLIYVTPKNSQHTVAEEAVEKLREQGSKVRSLTITAKSKVCLKAEPLCNPKYCEYAKDYYKKIDEHQLIQRLNKMRSLNRSKLKSLGEEFEVCPFELSVEAIDGVDVVIGDYNYVFAPRGLLGRLSEPLLENNEKPNLVIDEAHNLPARSQDYFSPSLSTNQLNILERLFHKLPNSYAFSAQLLILRAKALIGKYGREGTSRKIKIDWEPIEELDKEIRELTIQYLDSEFEIQPQDPLLRFMNLWSEFAQSSNYCGPEFFQTYQNNSYGESIKITCCDASEQLQLAYKEFKNVIAFSATLKPFSYYQEMLGFTDMRTKTLEFLSPFAKENRKILIIPQVSTKYSDRTINAPKIAEVIHRIIRLKTGNYMALFPSFEFMFMVARLLDLPRYTILVQEREMRQQQAEQYLEHLKSSNMNLLLGVQGGVFSEGVDFPGSMLIGAFVIGPALPNFDFEREQIRAYYESRFGKENAFQFAYVCPAMAKAVQSAGRVIRSETDQGIIILMDSRFLQKTYAVSMPESWFKDHPQELVSKSILNDLNQFWDSIHKLR